MRKMILTAEKEGKRKILYVEMDDNFILQEKNLQGEVAYTLLNKHSKVIMEYEAETEEINEIEQFLKESVYYNHSLDEYKGIPFLYSYDKYRTCKRRMDLRTKQYYACPERRETTQVKIEEINDKIYFVEVSSSRSYDFYAVYDVEDGKTFEKNNYDNIVVKDFTGEPRIYRVLDIFYKIIEASENKHNIEDRRKDYYEDVETGQVYERDTREAKVKKSIGIVIKEFLDSKPQPFYLLKDGDKTVYKSVLDTFYGIDRYFTEDGKEYCPEIK